MFENLAFLAIVKGRWRILSEVFNLPSIAGKSAKEVMQERFLLRRVNSH
jgi:hypothetical protein